eukprot:1183636-Prorocentrum_minimum.AAC.2
MHILLFGVFNKQNITHGTTAVDFADHGRELVASPTFKVPPEICQCKTRVVVPPKLYHLRVIVRWRARGREGARRREREKEGRRCVPVRDGATLAFFTPFSMLAFFAYPYILSRKPALWPTPPTGALAGCAPSSTCFNLLPLFLTPPGKRFPSQSAGRGYKPRIASAARVTACI